MNTIDQELFLEHLSTEALHIQANTSEEAQWEELYQTIEILLADCGIRSNQFLEYEELNDILVTITDQAFKSIKVKFLPRLALINAIGLLDEHIKEHKGNIELYNEMKEAVKNQKE